MKNISFITIIILAALTNTIAQEKEEYSKWEIYGGYSRMKSANEDNYGTKDEKQGYEVAVTRNFNRYFGAKFSHSANFLSESGIDLLNLGINAKYSNYTFAGGIQVKDNSSKGRIKPFAHALFGITKAKADIQFDPCPAGSTTCQNSVEQNQFTMIFGGGVDIKINKRITIRPVQIDYLKVNNDLYSQKTSRFRLGAGIVFTTGDVEIPLTARTKDYAKYEIHVGYSYNKRSLDGLPAPGNIYRKGLQGYNSSIKWNFQRFLGAEFEHSAGWSGKEEATVPPISIKSYRALYTFAGGIQVKDNSPETRFKPFGHALFGGVVNGSKVITAGGVNMSTNQIQNRSSFVMIFGGGLDVKVNNKFSVRVFQFDYLRNHDVSDYQAKYYRFGAGIVFH